MASISSPVQDYPRETPRTSGRGRLVVVILGLTLAHVFLLVAFAQNLWRRPHYQFFPLLLVGAVVLAIQRGRGLGSLQPGSRVGCSIFLSIAYATLTLGVIFWSPWLGAVATLFTLAALILGLGGGALFRALWPSWVLLWVAVPPPYSFDERLITFLQEWTVHWGSNILSFLGMFHVLTGNVIAAPDRSYFIEEACSGIHSLFAVLAATLFFVFWTRMSALRALLLMPAAVFWALVANIARVVGVVYLCSRANLDVSAGWAHELFGLVLFLLTLLLIASSDRLVCFLTPATRPARPRTTAIPAPRMDHAAVDATEAGTASGEELSNDALTEPGALPVPSPAPSTPPSTRTRLADWHQTWLAGFRPTLVYGLLAALQMSFLTLTSLASSVDTNTLTNNLALLGRETLPEHWRDAHRLDYDYKERDVTHDFGNFSRTWSYRLQGEDAAVSLDYPFQQMHDLTHCYISLGWTVEESVSGIDAQGLSYTHVRFVKPDRHAYLWFTLFDQSGQAMAIHTFATYMGTRLKTFARPWQRLLGRDVSLPEAPGSTKYQVQLFMESYQPLTTAQQEQAEAFFGHVRTFLRPPWTPVEKVQR